jgi:predicted esterase
MNIRLPSNYTPERRWPVVFFYHGAQGGPDTRSVRNWTEGKDFIVVGMPYLESGTPQRNHEEHEKYVRKEIENFRRVRAWLGARASIDEARVLMGGVSKGGWTAAVLGEREIDRLAGLIIVLAGRLPSTGAQRTVPPLRNKPIYIGAGETDPNLPDAYRARAFYRRVGAVVTFEEYPGMGHAVPPAPKHLMSWLKMRGAYRQLPKDGPERKAIKKELEDAYREVAAEADPMRKYAALRSLAGDPRLVLCGRGAVTGMEKRLQELRGRPPVKEEWIAEWTFGRIAWKEWNIRRLADFRDVLDRLGELREQYSQTRFGRLADEYYPRLASAYEKSVEATRKHKEARQQTAGTTARGKNVGFSFPGMTSGGPRAMRRRGNKVTFE